MNRVPDTKGRALWRCRPPAAPSAPARPERPEVRAEAACAPGEDDSRRLAACRLDPADVDGCDPDPSQGWLHGPESLGLNALLLQRELRAIGVQPGHEVRVAVIDAGFPVALTADGYVVEHADLPTIPCSGPVVHRRDHIEHGLKTLGVLAATRTVVGLVPGAALWAAAIDTAGEDLPAELARLIRLAAGWVGPGGVVAVELQLLGPEPWPVYLHPTVRQALHDAAAIEVLVVTPSGNDQQDLDRLEQERRFGGEAVPMDCGALVVGAVFPRQDIGDACYERVVRQCGHGRRVGCHGWGAEVLTLGLDGPDAYSGTSSATAMIAGAAALLQSWVLGHYGLLLDAASLRAWLQEPSCGAPARDREGVEQPELVGVMPDLGRVVQAIRGLTSG